MKDKVKSTGHDIVSGEEWIEAQKKHLVREKEFTKSRDKLSEARRKLPWRKIENDYHFETALGKKTLSELFEGRSQLIVYHFMFDSSWDEGCKTCSLVADNFAKQIIHLNNRDVTMISSSRAPLDKLNKFRARMGWEFNWVSSNSTNFNDDFGVSFTSEEVEEGKTNYNYGTGNYPVTEAHGISVFAKDTDGNVFHTFSSYARGLDMLMGTYNFLDIVPKGRDEDELSYTMEWIRHHDKYN